MAIRRSMVLLAFVVGCSADAIVVPSISPRSVADAAMAAHDADKNGTLDAKEIEAVPSFRKLAAKTGGALTADAIVARLEHYSKTGVKLTSYAVTLTLDGKPLAGADVTFVPEAFLGTDYKPAGGRTDANGMASLVTEGQKFGAALGFYRVRVSKKDAQGKETIPAKYNDETTLGCEVGPEGSGGRVANDDSGIKLVSGK